MLHKAYIHHISTPYPPILDHILSIGWIWGEACIPPVPDIRSCIPNCVNHLTGYCVNLPDS